MVDWEEREESWFKVDTIIIEGLAIFLLQGCQLVTLLKVKVDYCVVLDQESSLRVYLRRGRQQL